MTTAIASINLHAMPMNFDEWAKITSGLTAAQEGTLLRATRVAWQAGHRGAPAASLPNDDAALGRMLGGREHLDVVRRLFQPDEQDATILVWSWLAKAYAEALKRYENRKLAGVESGQTRRRRAKAREGSGTMLEHCSNNARAMREQPKPNPVGVGSSNQPPTGGADAASALSGRTAPPEQPSEALAQVPPEQIASWVREHPAEYCELVHVVDDAMDQVNAEWRTLPKRFGADQWERDMHARIARRILGLPDLLPITLQAGAANA